MDGAAALGHTEQLEGWLQCVTPCRNSMRGLDPGFAAGTSI
jgi:hypothetical protein